jgi:hypothetical protein
LKSFPVPQRVFDLSEYPLPSKLSRIDKFAVGSCYSFSAIGIPAPGDMIGSGYSGLITVTGECGSNGSAVSELFSPRHEAGNRNRLSSHI